MAGGRQNVNNNGVIQPEQYRDSDSTDDDDDDNDDDESDDASGDSDELIDNQDTPTVTESNSKSPSSDLSKAVERSPRQCKKEKRKSLERLTEIRREEVRAAH